jgi:hypothetical protein
VVFTDRGHVASKGFGVGHLGLMHRRHPAARGSPSRQKVALAVGNIVDCSDQEGTFSGYGSDWFEICEGGSIATALLCCVRCKRSRMLHP